MDISDDAPALFVPEGNEDSVDIYEGLDFGSNNVVPEKSASSRLEEAMDLFEEIVTEEQQSKEASYAELKSRFQAAQSQITELHRRLDQLQLQNTGLTKENCRLKMNISILLQTARQEVARKDAEILRLNQMCSKGQYFNSRSQQDLGCFSQNQRLAPPLSLDPPDSQRLFKPSHRTSNEVATLPAPQAPLTFLKPSPLTNLPPDLAAPFPPPPPPKEALTLSDRPPLPPRPPSPPLPVPPLPKSSPSENGPLPIRKDTEIRTEPGSRSSEQSSQSSSEGLARRTKENSRTSERSQKHKHHTDKHKDRTHERKHSHKDRTSNLGDSKSGENNSKVFTSKSDPDKGYRLREGRSQDDRRDRVRDRQSRSSDSKEHRHDRDSSRSERRYNKQSYKEGRQECRVEDNARRHRRDSKEKHRPKEHSKKSSNPSERSLKEKMNGDKVTTEENSPHRKLCFMETLNLTLSPVKKPGIDSEKSDIAADALLEESQPNMDGMCVLDEVDSSESEAPPVDCSQPPPVDSPQAPTVEIPQAPTVESPQAPTVESPQAPTVESPQAPTVESPQAPTVENPQAPPVDCPQPPPVDCNKAPKIKTSTKMKDVGEAIQRISTTCDKEFISDNSIHSTSTNKAQIQKEEGLPKCPERTEKHGKTSTRTSCSDDILSVEPTNTAKSINPSENSKLTIMDKENISFGLRDKPVVSSKSPDAPTKNTLVVSPIRTENKDVSSQRVAPEEVETVSSSINLECLPQEGLSLPEAIDFLTQNNEDCSGPTSQELCSTEHIDVSKVSSTTHETTGSDWYTVVSKTPKKNFSPAKFLSPPRSGEKATKSTSSVPLLYDEDSMMRTLSNLKRIPDAISPLRSPVRISKRNIPYLQKPGHVKSLQKEFSSAPNDAVFKKVDVNKENKHPGSPATTDTADRVLAVPLDTELEEGEILSESDEVASPHPPTKKPKLKRPVRSKASPKCILTRKTEEKSDKETCESPEAIPSPSNKSRFKTVCPAATKASFCSIEEVMDTFKLVRYEIRKKYMKLHKSFPKKSFYGVMENFQESFIEFVDGADFGQICNFTADLKSKLKNIIVSVFCKVLNNGIVKRIFEQQAVDLKQKLWDFVDVQVDYLFKDVNMALKSLCKPARSPIKHRSTKGKDKETRQTPDKRKKEQSPRCLNGSDPCAVVPFKTGLGSRGKGIRITLDESNDTDDQSGPEQSAVVSIVSSTPEKVNSSLMVASSSSMLDKTDFELLTEQQATSLTFNLVRDSQMGEIFKCLLQGSDLLDSNAAGDQSAWALSTPRKDGERIITITTPGKFHTPSKLLTPNKFESPSRLITTWSSISPRKISSPSSKVLFNPALFDESCLLEVPSENKMIQRPYSILAEDLAVSLTIPSPLKSDSHLSFLQPPPVQVLSTPDSVLSAHISEDALLDEADATEHDIHLTLDTDNSSCGSSASLESTHATSTQFLFKPSIPMQALVMERSTDHFIVKIRQASSANSTLIADESQNQTLLEEIACEGNLSAGPTSPVQGKNTASIHSLTQDNIADKFQTNQTEAAKHQEVAQQDTGKKQLSVKSNSSEVNLSQASSFNTSSSDREEMLSECERSLTIAEKLESTPEKPQARKRKDRKRRKDQENPRAKKRRMDEDRNQATNCEAAGEDPQSPNSLPAKNLVRKKGEVVMAWTREEDRAILIELKTKGASRETFSFLSEKLEKPSAQIAQRFHQLMKLFKKMDT